MRQKAIFRHPPTRPSSCCHFRATSLKKETSLRGKLIIIMCLPNAGGEKWDTFARKDEKMFEFHQCNKIFHTNHTLIYIRSKSHFTNDKFHCLLLGTTTTLGTTLLLNSHNFKIFYRFLISSTLFWLWIVFITVSPHNLKLLQRVFAACSNFAAQICFANFNLCPR